MRHRVKRQLTSLFFLVLTLLQQILPTFSLLNLAYAVTASEVDTALTYDSNAHEFNLSINNATEAEYLIEYTYSQNGEVKQEALQGQANDGDGSVETTLFTGTCSGNDCTPHTGVSSGHIDLKAKDLNGEMQFYAADFIITNGLLWLSENGSQTLSEVQLNQTYTAPQNGNVKITFTSLPNPAGSITITEVTLSAEQMAALGAPSDKAYEITSTMADGTFAYTLELPVIGAEANTEYTVKWAESLGELNNAQTVTQTVTQQNGSVVVSGLNHFTVFVVVNTTGGSNSGVGTQTWNNTGNITTSNNQRATVSMPAGTTSHYLTATGSAAIPTNAVVTGITVTIERQVQQDRPTDTQDNIVRLMKAGSVVGSNYAQPGGWTTTDTVITYGSSNDLWGTTWTAADVNNPNFGVALSVSRGGSDIQGQTPGVDHIQITVHYVAITLLSPNGGEVYAGGSTQTIAWNAPDTDANPNDSLITLEYTTDGVNFVTIATNEPNDGSYTWTVPNINSTTVQVRATVTDGVNNSASANDMSDAVFTIGAMANPAPVLSFSGFRDQASAVYDNTQAIQACGATNNTGFIAWEWQLTNSPTNDPITYTYTIVSGPTAVGFTTTTANTYYNGQIPAQGTYIVEVYGTDALNNVSNTVSCSVTFDAPAPSAPLFWVEEDASSVELNWQAATNAVSYNIYRDGSLLTTLNSLTYSDATAGLLSTHTYEVRAVNAYNEESTPQTAKQAQTLDVVIDDNANGADLSGSGTFSASAGWSAFSINDSPVLQNAVGGDNYSTVGAASGQTATWTTAANLDGIYEVYVQYICDSSRGTAQYAINSGAFPVGTAMVDQSTTDGTTQCSGQSAISEAGANWISLGQFAFVNAQGQVQITAPNGEVNILADAVAFRYVSPYASIQGRKYRDVNGDGNFNASEQIVANRLNGWTISIYNDLNAAPIASMVTGDDTTIAGVVGNGQYRFVGLAAGTYYVCETQQTNWQQTEPASGVANPNADGTLCYTVTLAAGQSVTGRQFGNFELATITGAKINDLNGNGVIEAGEPGLGGWRIYVDADNSQSWDSTEINAVTDVTGTYSLPGLFAGTYSICEENQTGWTRTFPTGSNCQNVTVNTSGQIIPDINFANFELNTISGQKFNDVDADGVKDNGEPGIQGWSINISGSYNGGGLSVTTQTDVNGNYLFTDLLPGTYTVCEIDQADWTQTYPTTNAGCYPITVNLSGQDFIDQDFGNAQEGSIQGRKFEDENADHNHDGDDTFLDGWSVRLYQFVNGAWTFVSSMFTGDDTTAAGNVAPGQYRFTNLLTGQYALCEDMSGQPDGWIQTRPWSGNGTAILQSVVDGSLFQPTGYTNYCHTVNLDPNEDRVGVRFGNFKLAEVYGSKFEDVNANGARDASESGLPNWTIFVDANLNGTLDATESSTVTDSNGDYAFTGYNGLVLGTHQLCEVQQSGWFQTVPANGTCHSVNVTESTQTIIDLDFGNFQMGTLQGRKYEDMDADGLHDGAATEARLADWTIRLYRDFAGEWLSEDEMYTENDNSNLNPDHASGDVDAGQYRFTNLEPGTYYVCEVVEAGWLQTGPVVGANPVNFNGQVMNDAVAVANQSGETDEALTCWQVAIDQSGEFNRWMKFGNFELATITGTKWNDITPNGTRELGEPGLSGWTIYVDANNNQTLDGNEQFTFTDAYGNYTLSGFPLGTYSVCEVQQNYWRQMFPANNGCHTITVTESGQVFTENDFGNAQEGFISGLKFTDYLANGVAVDSDEAVFDTVIDVAVGGIDGWTINLFDAGWNFLESTTTHAHNLFGIFTLHGHYWFDHLLAGTYYVCEQPQDGWVQTTAINLLDELFGTGNEIVPDPNNPGYMCHEVNLLPGEINWTNWFANFQLATVSGVKFHDVNGDGVRNEGEPGLANWTIHITGTDVNGNSYDELVNTAADGTYTFAGNQSGLMAGTYQACEINQSNWVQTLPANPSCYTLEVVISGQQFTNVDFGNYFVPPTNGGGNGGGGTSAPGGASPQVCTDNAPSSAPANLHVQASGSNTVTLAWHPVSPASHYALVFTRQSDGAQFGSTNIGNVTSYTINGISGGADYTFEVFGVNGCMPGPRSVIRGRRITGPVLTARPVGQDGTVLGAEEVYYEEATPSATLTATNSAQVAGMSATCSDPWWKWLLFLAQAIVLAVAAWATIKRSRTGWLILAGLVTALVIVIIWLFFCDLLPWLYYALGITLIALGVREMWKQNRDQRPPQVPEQPAINPAPRRRRVNLRFFSL
ncbi:MAG TPA: SdrD B-like domain-containing protein [Vitreimonas sp.]|nr:SdrD B-like domain-containing protein [Vitreimonas sp.]